MRGAIRAFVGCLAVLAVAVVALVALAVLGGRTSVTEGPEPSPRPSGRPPRPAPTPDPDVFLSRVGRVNGFERAEDPAGYRLTYRFIDYGGRTRTVTCRVSRTDLQRSNEGYGLTPQRWAEINRRLLAALRAEVRQRSLERYFKVETYGRGQWRWSYQIPGDTEPVEYQRALGESQAFAVYLRTDFEHVGDSVKDQVMRQWGLRLWNNSIRVDHAGVVEQATAPLEDCARALLEQVRGGTVRQAMGVMLAFFQELRYELPPDEAERDIIGLWVPPDVLVRGAGDCDSKSLALCASWRRLPSRSIVVIIPKHALVGIEATPGPGERFVRLGNRYFVLVEPAGPGKLPPGTTDMKGDFEYVMFEPLPGVALP